MAELPPIPEEQKGYQYEIIADSVNKITGDRITTFELKYPLIVHAEFCRHRCFSRSVASNRTIRTERIIQMVEEDPFIPERFPIEQKGMQAEGFYELGSKEYDQCKEVWLRGRLDAIAHAKELISLGVHKQIANRVLAPYQWVREVITGTDEGYANFFALRDHSAAQGELSKMARMMKKEYLRRIPAPRSPGDFFVYSSHIPFMRSFDEKQSLISTYGRMSAHPGASLAVNNKFLNLVNNCIKDKNNLSLLAFAISAARCARTSLLLYEGKEFTYEEDLNLYCRLIENTPRHVSPTEHQAMPISESKYVHNLKGWRSHRDMIKDNTITEIS